jgi:hypothetical protein
MRYLPILAFAILICACNNSVPNIPQSTDNTSDSGIYFAYSPLYTNGYKPGNYKLVKTVTDFWRQFENGDVRTMAKSFADDDITFVYLDKVISGKKDTVLSQLKQIRDSYPAVQSFVYSWMPAKARDHDEDWVFIWGKQEYTDKDGHMNPIEVNEIWQFDKEGKVIFVRQYRSIRR